MKGDESLIHIGKPMTTEEFCKWLKRHGYRYHDVANLMGVSLNTARNWTAGKINPPSYLKLVLLGIMARKALVEQARQRKEAR